MQHPPLWPGTPLTAHPGIMTAADVANYTAKLRPPTHVSYRGLDVYGMAPPSSGGSTMGEALNILSGWDLSSEPRAQVLFQYLESSRLARGVNRPEGDVIDWPSINWRQVEDDVRRLRQRIFTASQAGDFKRLRNLQKLMPRSWRTP